MPPRMKTGDTKCREARSATATQNLRDGKIILADEDGALALFKPTTKKHQAAHQRPLVSKSIPGRRNTGAGHATYRRDRKTSQAGLTGTDKPVMPLRAVFSDRRRTLAAPRTRWPQRTAPHPCRIEGVSQEVLCATFRFGRNGDRKAGAESA